MLPLVSKPLLGLFRAFSAHLFTFACHINLSIRVRKQKPNQVVAMAAARVVPSKSQGGRS
jgi:hypothetical protein